MSHKGQRVTSKETIAVFIWEINTFIHTLLPFKCSTQPCVTHGGMAKLIEGFRTNFMSAVSQAQQEDQQPVAPVFTPVDQQEPAAGLKERGVNKTSQQHAMSHLVFGKVDIY